MAIKTRTCKNCLQPFVPVYRAQLYCSPDCRKTNRKEAATEARHNPKRKPRDKMEHTLAILENAGLKYSEFQVLETCGLAKIIGERVVRIERRRD